MPDGENSSTTRRLSRLRPARDASPTAVAAVARLPHRTRSFEGPGPPTTPDYRGRVGTVANYTVGLVTARNRVPGRWDYALRVRWLGHGRGRSAAWSRRPASGDLNFTEVPFMSLMR